MVDVKGIADKYGLEVEEVETGVYKVLNTDKVVDVTEIMEELQPGSCITIKSLPDIRRHEDGYGHLHAGAVYIILDFVDTKKQWFYEDGARELFKDAHNIYVEPEDPMADRRIDTIHSNID